MKNKCKLFAGDAKRERMQWKVKFEDHLPIRMERKTNDQFGLILSLSEYVADFF